MNDKIKKLIENKNNLIVVILIGVLCMVIALPVKKEEKEETVKQNSTGVSVVETFSEQQVGAETQTDTYARSLEKKLEETLSQMDGAGKVNVFITLKASEEKVVEKDTPITRSNTQEEDSQGGSRSVNNVDTKESTIYETQGSSSTPYIVKVISPQVNGVLVVAEGAGSGSVSKNISEAIQSLFGIEAHKIKVVKMKTP